MPDEVPGTTPPAPAAPPAPAPAPAPPASPPAAPRWDGPYDEARAASLIANLRAELAEVKARRTEAAPGPEVAELKTQLDALTAQMEQTRTAAVEAAKRAAIAEAGIPAALAGFVTGSTPEEIKASADALAAGLGAAQPAPSPLPGLPRPAPASGRAPNDATPAFDPDAVARKARRY
ncbi:Domain of unknown function [Micromonospora nigra]|uniref:Scaffolding protein n=1 Tax=Micromonospora nigra TaxID=145857 RepID=A0A1C6SU18_9ACTN|nr:hypothetical protein [Micromonospora nigra]SCL33031.1 Domain of unknown function [Micromonospora nigra]